MIKGERLVDLGVSGVRGGGTGKRFSPVAFQGSLSSLFFWFSRRKLGEEGRTRNELPGVWMDWDESGTGGFCEGGMWYPAKKNVHGPGILKRISAAKQRASTSTDRMYQQFDEISL